MELEKFNKQLDKILNDKTISEEQKQWKMINFGLKTMIKETKKANRELKKKYPELLTKEKREIEREKQ